MSIHGHDVLRGVLASLEAGDDYAPGVTDIAERVRAGAKVRGLFGGRLLAWLEDIDTFHARKRDYPKLLVREVSMAALAAVSAIQTQVQSEQDALRREIARLNLDINEQARIVDSFQSVRRIQTIVTPSGPLSVIRPVAEQLLAGGVISGTLDGDLHAADAATVKAALMKSAGVCDFCSAPGAVNVFDVPDFDMPHQMGRSTGGWAACDTCAELVGKNRRDALLKRSVESASFGKFSAGAIADLQAKFWRGMEEKAEAAVVAKALGDYVADRLPADVSASLKAASVALSDREQRIESVARITGLTRSKVLALTRGELDAEAVRKLVAWKQSFGKEVDTRQLADLLAGGQRKPLAPVLPHWQVALDMRFAAMQLLAKAEAPDSYYTPDVTDLNDREAIRKLATAAELARSEDVAAFTRDCAALRHAETYSFNAETAQAIMLAAASIPLDTPLSAIDTPGAGRAGWFWFAEPLAIVTCSESESVSALLWYWDQDDGRRPQLTMSAYVQRSASSGGLVTRGGVKIPLTDSKPLPSTNWNWYLTETLADLVAARRASYKQNESAMRAMASETGLIGEDQTVSAVATLSTFFVAACVWMKQKIAVSAPGHVERHARKRYVREHKLAEPPTVQVIALRKSQRDTTHEPSSEPSDGSAPGRQYQHRWVVSGHPRLQACGPGRADRKLIWIDPYPKGPEGMPLLVRKRVYAVVR